MAVSTFWAGPPAGVANEMRQQYLSAAKARARLDWAPSFTIDEGLAHTIRWYRDYFRESA